MNLPFAGYKELCRFRRVLLAKVDNTLRDQDNSSYPTQAHSLIANLLNTSMAEYIVIIILNP